MIYVLKLIFSSSLIFFIFYNIDKTKFIELISTVDKQFFIIAAISFFVATIFQILKLYNLLKKFYSPLIIAKVTLMGLFFNSFLPSNVGGVFYMIYLLKNEKLKVTKVFSLIFLDIVVGLSILLTSFLFYIILNQEFIKYIKIKKIDFNENYLLILFLSIFFSTSLFFLNKNKINIKYYLGKSKNVFQNVINNITSIKFSIFVIQIFLSLFFHLFKMLVLYFLIMSLNGNLLIWHNLIFVYSITTLGAALPLSIGGLGIREGILSVMLILLGLDSNIAVSVALLNLMFLWLIAFTGGMLFLFSKKIYQR